MSAAANLLPLTPKIYEFEVSGLKVVQSWLGYRMRNGAGRKSSPLDDIRPACWTSAFTTELLELLWVLEATVAVYPEQDSLLKAVIDGELASKPMNCRQCRRVCGRPPRARVFAVQRSVRLERLKKPWSIR